MENNMNQLIDTKTQQNKIRYVKQMDFYSKELVLLIETKNNTIYIQNLNSEILIMELFALNRQQKFIKRVTVQFSSHVYFMNQSSSFLVCSSGTFEIWRQDKSYNWQQRTILKDFKNYITTFTISLKDDLIINSLSNGLLQFRRKQDEWKCHQQLQTEQHCISELILNETADKLLSVDDIFISIFIFNSGQKTQNWALANKIKGVCKSACFIGQNNFMWLSGREPEITIYQIDKFSRLIIQNTFQLNGKQMANQTYIKYLKQKGLCLAMNGNQLFLINESQDKNYIVNNLQLLTEENQLTEETSVNLIKQGDFILITYFDDLGQCMKMELRRLA